MSTARMLIPAPQVRRVLDEISRTMCGLRRLISRISKMANRHPVLPEMESGSILRSEHGLVFQTPSGSRLTYEPYVMTFESYTGEIQYGLPFSPEEIAQMNAHRRAQHPWVLLTEHPSPWMDTSEMEALLEEARIKLG